MTISGKRPKKNGGLTLDVMRNDHIRQETVNDKKCDKKCQPWNDREIGGQSADSCFVI